MANKINLINFKFSIINHLNAIINQLSDSKIVFIYLIEI